MLEMTTGGGTVRFLYNTDGAVQRVLIGEGPVGECPPLISITPVGPSAAAREVAALADVPANAVLDALRTSQGAETAEDTWHFRISYDCGLIERRPTRTAARERALASADVFGPAEMVDEKTGEVFPVEIPNDAAAHEREEASQMITVTVEKRYGVSGATTVRARISAPTIERAVELAGEGARLVLPIEAETFFAARRGYPVEKAGIDFERMSHEDLEFAYEVGLPGAYEAYLDALRSDMGEDAFERYALENCLL